MPRTSPRLQYPKIKKKKKRNSNQRNTRHVYDPPKIPLEEETSSASASCSPGNDLESATTWSIKRTTANSQSTSMDTKEEKKKRKETARWFSLRSSLLFRGLTPPFEPPPPFHPPPPKQQPFLDDRPSCQASREGERSPTISARSQLPRWFSPARNNTGESERVSAHSGSREGIISGESAAARGPRSWRKPRDPIEGRASLASATSLASSKFRNCDSWFGLRSNSMVEKLRRLMTSLFWTIRKQARIEVFFFEV